jgi:ABC-type Fe3+/spermidine/putrescine transport system ATPase subunit
VLECRDVSVRYGNHPILREVSLTVGPGEAVGLLGPSGSGKTTLVYTVAGFVVPVGGRVLVGGVEVAGPGRFEPPERRSVGVVFQNYALWPHMSATEIVAYPLRRAGVSTAAAAREARELLDLVGIGELAARRPAELSGGQQQRVGLARALARRPALYLFDEPTAHLDGALRAVLQEELVARRKDSGAAALYATHDADEALAVSDRVAVLRDGRIVQVGTPREIYERPVDLWSARLTGPAWCLDAEATGDRGEGPVLRVGGARVAVDSAASIRGRTRLVVRPDWVAPGPGLEGVVAAIWYRGPHTDYRIDTPAGTLEMRVAGGPGWEVGGRLSVEIRRGWPVEDGTGH